MGPAGTVSASPGRPADAHHLASQAPHRACSLSLMTGWASDLTFYSTQLLGMGCSSPTPSTVLEEKRLRGATVTVVSKKSPIRPVLHGEACTRLFSARISTKRIRKV